MPAAPVRAGSRSTAVRGPAIRSITAFERRRPPADMPARLPRGRREHAFPTSTRTPKRALYVVSSNLGVDLRSAQDRRLSGRQIRTGGRGGARGVDEEMAGGP